MHDLCTFTATARGTRSTTVNRNDDRGGSRQKVALTGTSTGVRGYLHAWVRVSIGCLEPELAAELCGQSAHMYGGDPANTDECHLGSPYDEPGRLRRLRRLPRLLLPAAFKSDS